MVNFRQRNIMVKWNLCSLNRLGLISVAALATNQYRVWGRASGSMGWSSNDGHLSL